MSIEKTVREIARKSGVFKTWGEAQRIILSGSVKIDGKVAESPEKVVLLREGSIVQIGRKHKLQVSFSASDFHMIPQAEVNLDCALISNTAQEMYDALAKTHTGPLGEAFGTVRDLINMGILPFEFVAEIILGKKSLVQALEDASEAHGQAKLDFLDEIQANFDGQSESEADFDDLIQKINRAADVFGTVDL